MQRNGRMLARNLAVRVGTCFWGPQWGNCPRDTVIEKPFNVRGASWIYFGNRVRIGPYSIIKASVRNHFRSPRITIGNNVYSESRLHLAAYFEITIGDGVVMASNVFMADSLHGISRTDIPFKDQLPDRVAPVVIGDRASIGPNVVILPGVEVGEGAIVEGNSVVTRSVPAGCLASGAPARIVRCSDE